jgi:hypothetical protein
MKANAVDQRRHPGLVAFGAGMLYLAIAVQVADVLGSRAPTAIRGVVLAGVVLATACILIGRRRRPQADARMPGEMGAR